MDGVTISKSSKEIVAPVILLTSKKIIHISRFLIDALNLFHVYIIQLCELFHYFVIISLYIFYLFFYRNNVLCVGFIISFSPGFSIFCTFPFFVYNNACESDIVSYMTIPTLAGKRQNLNGFGKKRS
jgi:hypothetical protein